jgi:hypothetical protein
MNETTHRIQDHPLDESTGVTPQHFDAEGYVAGHPHHAAVANEDLTPEGTLISETPGAATAAYGTSASAAPDAPDGQFDDQRMPATDGELSDADAAPRPDASIAPPPADPDAPIPGAPEGVPPGPDVTPAEPNPTVPDEPAPLAPEEPDQGGSLPRTVGGDAF